MEIDKILDKISISIMINVIFKEDNEICIWFIKMDKHFYREKILMQLKQK